MTTTVASVRATVASVLVYVTAMTPLLEQERAVRVERVERAARVEALVATMTAFVIVSVLGMMIVSAIVIARVRVQERENQGHQVTVSTQRTTHTRKYYLLLRMRKVWVPPAIRGCWRCFGWVRETPYCVPIIAASAV